MIQTVGLQNKKNRPSQGTASKQKRLRATHIGVRAYPGLVKLLLLGVLFLGTVSGTSTERLTDESLSRHNEATMDEILKLVPYKETPAAIRKRKLLIHKLGRALKKQQNITLTQNQKQLLEKPYFGIEDGRKEFPFVALLKISSAVTKKNQKFLLRLRNNKLKTPEEHFRMNKDRMNSIVDGIVTIEHVQELMWKTGESFINKDHCIETMLSNLELFAKRKYYIMFVIKPMVGIMNKHADLNGVAKQIKNRHRQQRTPSRSSQRRDQSRTQNGKQLPRTGNLLSPKTSRAWQSRRGNRQHPSKGLPEVMTGERSREHEYENHDDNGAVNTYFASDSMRDAIDKYKASVRKQRQARGIPDPRGRY